MEHERTAEPSRRHFLQAVGLGGAAIAGATLLPGRAAAVRQQTVAVFGGGVAGLTAARELIERGFEVAVYERRAWGGKARSTIVPGSATGGRKPLPGEHAFRAEFGYYQNLPDTMRRIPFDGNRNGVFDNMVGAPDALVMRVGKSDLVLPLEVSPTAATPAQFVDTVVALLIDMEVPPAAATYFAHRLVVFLTSCDARRWTEWDDMSWLDFIAADRFGDDYRKFLGRAIEFIQGTKGSSSCARYPATVFANWIVLSLSGRGTNGPVMRMLNAPTNDAWIDPWTSELTRLGVRLHLGHELTAWHYSSGRITGAAIMTPSGPRDVIADWYVCALPMERTRSLLTEPMRAADPQLVGLDNLKVDQYNGISYYVRNRPEITDGLGGLIDSPWAGSFVQQAKLWGGNFAATYGDGTVHEKISAVVADWDTPGIIYGVPAKDLPPDKVARELWAQLKQHANKPGLPAQLRDEDLHSWQIDPGMLLVNNRLVSGDPLIEPTIGTGKYRPSPKTAISNFILAGDYLDGDWEVANMEAACFNGRRAANVILSEARSPATPSKTIQPYNFPEWEPLRRLDEMRYSLRQGNLFDRDLGLAELHALLEQPISTYSNLAAGVTAPITGSLGG